MDHGALKRPYWKRDGSPYSNTVEQWITTKVGLPQYLTNLKENGVEDMETVRLLTAKDIADEMGIVNEHHVERLVFAVEEEKSKELAQEWSAEIDLLVHDRLQCHDRERLIRREMVKYIRDRIENLEHSLNTTLWANSKPLRLRANTFGSELWKVSSRGSDIDVAISVNFSNYRVDKQRLLGQLLRIISHKDDGEMYLIDREYLSLIEASYPIVRVKHRSSGIEMDISIADRWCLPTNRLVLQCIERCSKVLQLSIRTLILLIKHWSKRRAINDSYHGLLNSFAFTLMAIHFAQSLISRKAAVRSIADLVRGFFEFYAMTFRFDCYAVNIEGADKMKKRTTDPMEIVDPIKSKKCATEKANVAGKVGYAQRWRVVQELRRAHRLFKDGTQPLLPRLLEAASAIVA